MSIYKLLGELEYKNTLVPAYQLNIQRALTAERLFSVGQGQIHTLSVAESELNFMRWFGTELLKGSFPNTTILLLGDRASGTTWTGIATLTLLALHKKLEVCIYCSSSQVEEVHRTIGEILPNHWCLPESEHFSMYHVGRQARLYVAVLGQPNTWRPSATIAMVNDYTQASREKIQSVIKDTSVQIICGNPPQENKHMWIEDLVLRPGSETHLFRFQAKDNQFLSDRSGQVEQVINCISPEYYKNEESFWTKATKVIRTDQSMLRMPTLEEKANF